ncbi:PilZ domain-containing protein [Cohnella ginsengisoli]|uniref:PilZ domain-containing protein n=1 Tax=Cohnella ginsengisoli TaxID=425004 RepID=A0A9X4QKI0_9BACL|nr:PilZ domain-containing protein [Cohnella ginsengisoli]MDG0789693.1 PilZ domain-containing protein [Cohnella ginsengisoli]
MLPKIGQMLYIQPHAATNDDGPPGMLRSRVTDADDRFLYVDIPIDEQTRRLHRTQPGDELKLTYFTSEGVKHQFGAHVHSIRREGISQLVIPKPDPDQITREQRRSFLRVEAQLEIAVRLGEKLRFTALTDDVGGGGVSFRCDRKWPITPNMKASCWLLLSYKSGAVSHAQFEAEIVRIVPVEPHHHLVMMRFQDIQDTDQQKIIRYCFEKQLERRKD